MLEVCLPHKSIHIPFWRTYCKGQLSSWGRYTGTAGCITGFEAGLVALCKRLATTLPSKSEIKISFKRLQGGKTALVLKVCLSDHLWIYFPLLLSLPLHIYKFSHLIVLPSGINEASLIFVLCATPLWLVDLFSPPFLQLHISLSQLWHLYA